MYSESILMTIKSKGQMAIINPVLFGYLLMKRQPLSTIFYRFPAKRSKGIDPSGNMTLIQRRAKSMKSHDVAQTLRRRFISHVPARKSQEMGVN